MTRYAEIGGRGCCPLCAALSGQVTRTQDARQPRHPWYREIDDGSTEPLCGVLCRECVVVVLQDEDRQVPDREDLRAWREAESLTQEQAAAVAGVDRVTWARWETEARDVPQWLADTLRQRWGTAP